MTHALAEFAVVLILSFALGVIGYTVGQRYPDIINALRGRPMR